MVAGYWLEYFERRVNFVYIVFRVESFEDVYALGRRKYFFVSF